MSHYQASTPKDGSVKPETLEFFEKFYKISDTAESHEEYADSFTSDGRLIMIANETSGREGIIKTRHGMWEKVAARSHKPAKIYSFGAGSDDVMLYGTVDYQLKDGKKATDIEWAARAHLVKDAGKLKMDFYQVYLDSASMASKAK